MTPSHLTNYVLQNTPRLLSWIDRRKASPTYGCSDRNFWHYRISDFPCAMLQESALTLALLFRTDFEGNVYFGKEYIRELAIAQVRFWRQIQRRSGAFDEFFPREHSFSATAFTLYSSLMVVKTLGLDTEESRKVFWKACRFLVNYGDPGASNQVAAAVAALGRYSEIYSDPVFDRERDRLLRSLLATQSIEGWTPEYGGFDVGYQSITLSYLSDFQTHTGSAELGDALNRMVVFLANFIHPDGTAGGVYGSRSTAFLAPFGFAHNAKKSSVASAVMQKVFQNSGSVINRALDDRYISHFILPSYLLAIEALKEVPAEPAKLPSEQYGSSWFSESGIYIRSTLDYYFVCCLKKQGVFQLYRRDGKKELWESGLTAEASGLIAVTNWLSDSCEITQSKDELKIHGAFFAVSHRTPNSFYHLGLRIGSMIFGRRMLRFLKKRLITRSAPLEGYFKRTIRFSDDEIEIVDEISLPKRQKLSVRIASPHSNYRYVAPSNYFSEGEMNLDLTVLSSEDRLDSDSTLTRTIEVHDLSVSTSIYCE